MATLLKANGQRLKVLPANGHTYTLKELQGYVGGYVEHVHLGRRNMWVNEEGRLEGLPVNLAASRLVYGDLGGVILGDVLVTG